MIFPVILAAGFLPSLAVVVAAQQSVDPDEVVLKVTVNVPGHHSETLYDRGDLAAMRVVDFRTSTIWTNGALQFRGVPLSEFVRLAGVSDGSVLLSAANDYVTDIPVSEIEADAPIVAFAMDGKPMSLRDKGPLWVVYPYDQNTAYQSEVIFTRSVWQLTSIEILP